MIESPELEIVRRELERLIMDRRVKSIEVLSEKVSANSAEELNERLYRAKIVGDVIRRGLQLLISFDNEEVVAVYLGAGGHLRRLGNLEPRIPETRLVVNFTQYGGLRVIDHKEGARFNLLTEAQRSQSSPAVLDPLQDSISWLDFSNVLLARPPDEALKTFLMDQEVIVGIGSMYSDEILFQAGLRYDRPLGSLGRQEIRRLWRSVVEVLHDAVKYRGTSLEENYFVSPSGDPGVYQDHLSVFRREGQLSTRSRRPIVREKYRGRWTYFCQQSQV